MTVNKAILVGRLGQDPDVRVLTGGGKVVNLNIATEQRWKDKNTSEPKSQTQWHRVVIWNENVAKVAEQYLRKGSRCYIEGQIEYREYEDQGGEKRKVTEITIRPFNGELKLLDSKDDANGGSLSSGGGSQSGGGASGRSGGGGGGRSGGGSQTPYDDEIPF